MLEQLYYLILNFFPFDLHRKGHRFCCHFFRFAARRQVYRTILTQFLSLQPRKYAKSAYFLSCRHRKCVTIVAQTLRQFTCPYLFQKVCPQRGYEPGPPGWDLNAVTTTRSELDDTRRIFWCL